MRMKERRIKKEALKVNPQTTTVKYEMTKLPFYNTSYSKIVMGWA